jgi:hypothetical protein
MTQLCGNRAIRSTSVIPAKVSKVQRKQWHSIRRTFKCDCVDFVVNVETWYIFPVAEEYIDEFVHSDLFPISAVRYIMAVTDDQQQKIKLTSSRIITSQL